MTQLFDLNARIQQLTWSLILYEKYSTSLSTIVLVVLTTANFWGFSNFYRYYTRSQADKSTGYRPTLKPLVIRYISNPKWTFFYHTCFFFGYILTVNTSSHVPVWNFEEKNCVIQNAIITWTDIFFRTCVLYFFHLSLVKTIFKSAKYPVDNIPSLWKTITLFHKDEVPEIIKLAQYALTLPLHTCSCERVFSNQNLIVTRLRSRLNPKIRDRLLRVRTQG